MQTTESHEELITDNRTPKPSAFLKKILIGILFTLGIVLILTIDILVVSSRRNQRIERTVRSPPPLRYPHPNPYFVATVNIENEKLTKIILTNERQRLENTTIYTDPIDSYVPIIKETYENHEPKILEVQVMEYDEQMARIKYLDPLLRRWEVPYFEGEPDLYAKSTKFDKNSHGFKLHENVNGSFQWYYHSSTNTRNSLIDTYACRFQYFDKYLEFEAAIDSGNIAGMGERLESFILKNGNYSFWNSHRLTKDKQDAEIGMSGSHPFFLAHVDFLDCLETKTFFGIFMRNSNGMLFSKWGADYKQYINYKIIGGVIDLFIFHNGEAQDIVRKYHSVIGKPYLPPLWAMGFQQAGEGYTAKDLGTVIKKHQEYQIPIDGLWADHEMNEGYRAFTVNKISFRGIKELVEKMHRSNMKFVAIANPGIKKDKNYKYYTRAIEEDIFIRTAVKPGNPFEGQTIAGVTIWLDFFTYKAQQLWAEGLLDLREQTLFDGIWISENEPLHDCYGECQETSDRSHQLIPNPFHNASEFKYLQYRPTIDTLDRNTLHMAAYHQGDEKFNKQYFTHNLFGLQISKATFDGLSAIFNDKRYFVASRSTWAGSGQYASHWLDGNLASWISMSSSIPSMLNFNMFGIPHVGAPIGGHQFNCTAELLRRWFAVGGFSPLMLSYSASKFGGKEAYAYPDEIKYIKETLALRYRLLRFLHTKMFEAHLWGGSVIHPLYFSFPNHTILYRRDFVDNTFVWADALFVVPDLLRGCEEMRVYLPNWNWYDLHTYKVVEDYTPYLEGGRYYFFDVPKGPANVFIKGGNIIPHQRPINNESVMNAKDLDDIPVDLIVAPDHEYEAKGTYLIDTEDTRSGNNAYRYYSFTYKNRILKVNMLAGSDLDINKKCDYLRTVAVLHNEDRIVFASIINSQNGCRSLQFVEDEQNYVLYIHDEGHNPIPLSDITAIVFGTEHDIDPCDFQPLIGEIEHASDEQKLGAKKLDEYLKSR